MHWRNLPIVGAPDEACIGSHGRSSFDVFCIRPADRCRLPYFRATMNREHAGWPVSTTCYQRMLIHRKYAIC